MSTKPSFTACYEWKLPEFTVHRISHLLSCYIRQKSSQYSLFIPQDITQTCVKYYYDTNILQSIKTCDNGTCFKSNLFSIGPVKFYMDVFPNGYDSDSKGNVDWFLNLSSISPTIRKISLKYEIQIKEVSHKYTNHMCVLTHEELSVGWDKLSFTTLHSLNTLTFILYVTISDLFDADDQSIIHKNIATDLFQPKPLPQIALNHYLIENETFYQNTQTQFLDSQSFNYALLPSQCGQWSVTDNGLLNQIKQCQVGTKFDSDIFIANGLKWSIKLYPNGTSASDKGNVALGIYLVTLSPNISKIWIQYRLLLRETNTWREDTVGFARRNMGYLFMTTLTFEELQSLPSLSFIVEIIVFDIFVDKSGAKISMQECYAMHNQSEASVNPMQSLTYKWTINDSEKLEKIKRCHVSDMFLSEFFLLHGFKWFLELYPNGQQSSDESNDVNLYLTLLSIPPNYKSISVYFELGLQETNAKYGAFEQLESECMSYGWPCNIVKYDSLMPLNTLTFTVKIKLIDIYDNKGMAMANEEKECGLSLPQQTHSYKWHICDNIFLERIFKARNAEYFPSDIFILGDLKWVMQICPMGSSPVRKGHFNWYLHLASLPSEIHKLYIFYRIHLRETHSLYEYRTVFQCRQPGKGWGNDKLGYKDIIGLETFTFELEIIVIDVFDKFGNNINDSYKRYLSPIKCSDNECIQEGYEWSICDTDLINEIRNCDNGSVFKSVVFKLCGFEWFLQIFPNGKDQNEKGEFKLYLHLGGSVFENDISGISCHFMLFVEETETIYSDFAHFRYDFLFDGWQSSRIKTEQIKELEKLTVKVMIKVIDVYDAHGMPITDIMLKV